MNQRQVMVAPYVASLTPEQRANRKRSLLGAQERQRHHVTQLQDYLDHARRVLEDINEELGLLAQFDGSDT